VSVVDSAPTMLLRGLETAASSWSRIAAGTPHARVLRRPETVIAVFPQGPEREFYNNAPVVPGLGEATLRAVLDDIDRTYARAGVDRYAVWAQQADAPLVRALEARDYRLEETTLAMGLDLTSADLPAMPPADLAAPSWEQYREGFLPAGLLAGVDGRVFRVLLARHRGRAAATALAHDHEGDCGIFNVETEAWARRNGLARALTLRLLHDARDRGLTTATLQSTPMAEGVYASVGFTRLGRILEYVPPAAEADED
jgi:GNAT superfamily N-acetyltransferase